MPNRVPQKPVVSVVIPCREEERHIKMCMQNVVGFDAPPGGMEIVVVDGMSDDGTRGIVRSFMKRDSRIRLLNNPDRFVSSALNRGIRAARGGIIVRVDAHAEYAKDYVRTCVSILKQKNADNVGGPARTKAVTYIQKAVAIAYHSKFSVGGARFHDIRYEGWVDTVTYGCFRKKKLEAIGLFDERMIRNQDDELNLRLIRAGGKIWQSPCIRSWYFPRDKIGKLFKQYFQYGFWKVRVIQKHRMPASIRHLVPGMFVLFLLIGGTAALFLKPICIVFLIVLCLYLAVNLIISFKCAVKEGIRYLPVLPIVFATYHLSYGLGFILGFFHFYLLRGKRNLFVSLSR